MLAVRSFVALALSRWDYVFSGMFAPSRGTLTSRYMPARHTTQRLHCRPGRARHFCTCLCTREAWDVPASQTGISPCCCSRTFVSRNPLTRASVSYLLDSRAPFSEGPELRTSLASLRTRMHTYPFPLLQEAIIHKVTHSAQPLPDIPWVVTDGALTATTLGGGIVLYHPHMGVLQTYHLGFLVVWATSADAEWLPKLVSRYLLRNRTAQAYFLAGAMVSMHCAYTKPPPPPPALHHHQPPVPPIGHRRVGFLGFLAASPTCYRPRALYCSPLAQGALPRCPRRRRCPAFH